MLAVIVKISGVDDNAISAAGVPHIIQGEPT
jgi:hypothetical protein